MGRFTVIANDAFDALQVDAGVILTTFDVTNPYKTPTSDEILATTSGGVNPTCIPTFSDYGEDVDNVPANMMEFKHLDSWEAKMAFTTIKFNAANTKWALGAADTQLLANGTTKIAPRRDVKQTDFKDLWWVGDKANGGAYAIKLLNALSTGGLSIQSTKNGKGTNKIEVTGHVSINQQDVMPMEIYDIPPQESVTNYTVTFDSNGGTSVDSQVVTSGATATEPVDPTRADYQFDGWFTDIEFTEAYDFSTPVTTDITLYAKWTELFEVTFDMQSHGDAIDPQTVADGGLVTEPEDPTADGYTFGGWFKEAGATNEWDFETDTVTADTTLYAKWTVT